MKTRNATHASRWVLCAFVSNMASVSIAHAAGADANPLPFKPLVDVRARWESVDQAGLPQQADASTIRARLGFETKPLLETTLLVEGEFVRALDDDYNSTINGKTRYPVIGDSQTDELNRLQLTNVSIPGTAVIVGRQRIMLDDQRFVGNAAWRQNEQTYDSARLVNQSIDKLIFDVAYVEQVNRVAGKDSSVGRFEGDSVLVNVGYQLPVGKLTAFGYRLSFDVLDRAPAAQRNVATSDSSQTFGARLSGEHAFERFKLAYAASYATQEDYGRNPIDYCVDYYLGELSASVKAFNAGFGLEVLQGDGHKGFATPLSSLHKFQGWADKFLTTPVNGIRDRYANLGYGLKNVGILEALSASVAVHDYEAERGGADYGYEVDVQVLAKWKKLNGLLKYADYHADKLFTDTHKLWLQLEYVW